MDKSSKEDYSLDDQVRAWNKWNEDVRGDWRGDSERLNVASRRQTEIVEGSIEAIGQADLRIIEVGCGSGWLCDKLQRFGKVTGTDLADESLDRASATFPNIEFVSGDFMKLDFPWGTFDVAVTLEVLSHFVDQPAFCERLARLLKPGGLLIVATQNRPVLERWSAIPGPTQGQVRKWVNAAELKQMLAPQFEDLTVESILPVGDQGILRFVNSVKLNRLAGAVFPASAIERAKERAMLGQTLIARGRKRPE